MIMKTRPGENNDNDDDDCGGNNRDCDCEHVDGGKCQVIRYSTQTASSRSGCFDDYQSVGIG